MVLAAACGGILWLNYDARALLISIAVLAIALWPKYRRPLVALGTFYSLLVFTLGASGAPYQQYLAVLLFFVFAGICIYQAHLRPDTWIFRRPVSPSFCIFSSEGITVPRSWKMIEADGYLSAIRWAGHCLVFAICSVFWEIYLVPGLRFAGPPQKESATCAGAVVPFPTVLGQHQCSLPQGGELSCEN